MKTALRTGLVLFGICATLAASPPSVDAQGSASNSGNAASTYAIRLEGATIQVDFAAGKFDLPQQNFADRIQRAANAVAVYYGRFPVSRARVLVIPVANEDGVLQGTTWGSVHGAPAFTRLRIGQHTTKEELASDWIMTHELVHMALTSLPDDEEWLEEGIATYVEPIARVQSGELAAEKVWGDMVSGMPNGEPRANDRGMNRTHTWGRTYWGGAMFCLLADVEIRKQTKNQKGLQDALRAIVAAGGTIDTDWPVDRVLREGDRVTGTRVLEEMYAKWSREPVKVDLDNLWKQLGVSESNGQIRINSVAPLADVRVLLTARSQQAILPDDGPSVVVPNGNLGP
jgi:hypothetical protein